MKRLWFLSLFFLMILSGLNAWATPEKPQLGLDESFPLEGQPVKVYISHPTYPRLQDFEVSATYRPNSEVSFTEKLPAPNSYGVVEWSPQQAGIVTLSAKVPELALSKNISVRYVGFPPSGLAILGLAAFILFGGLITVILRTSRAST